MTKQEIFELMNNNPVFFLATIEENEPRVRGMLLYKADEEGVIFHTGTMKDVYQQITKNSKVEMCFNDLKLGVQVRVKGELESIDDNSMKDEISEHPTREFLKPWKHSVSSEDFYKTFVVFKMRNGIANVWTFEKNLLPKEQIKL
ncbi:pyridoxamine 5'-phosphate oxidase family protein [Wukongibacter baidiensis]|uniref:pyridoxamine 5'-phosphate oxidase family protein n=1 Tax=Wukongibacter baidiensis TaxID=1723361 RepID=UPI003D7F555E